MSKTSKRGSNGSVIWHCKCECGNYKDPPYDLLLKESGKRIGQLHVNKNIIEYTNIQIIQRSTPMRHNTSGYTGVIFNKRRNNWRAEIRLQNKRYHLGSFDKKDDAIEARKKAEAKMHKQFLIDHNIID